METIKIDGPKLVDLLPLETAKVPSEFALELASSCAQLLISNNAENYVGEVITVSTDGGDGPAFEIVVTTQKVGAISPHERATQLDASNREWIEKTDWVQQTCKPLELGKHRADALRERIEALEAEVERLEEQACISGKNMLDQFNRANALQSELTKARELNAELEARITMKDVGIEFRDALINEAQEIAHHELPENWMARSLARIANQSAPADKES